MKKLVLLSLVSAGLLLTQMTAIVKEKNQANLDTCKEVERNQHALLAKEDTEPDFVVVEDKNVGTNFY